MINYPDMLQPLIDKFLPFAQKKMGFSKPPRLFIRGDEENACNPLGKTAFYDADNQSITLYVTKRHPKDVLRSLSHELVHHTQHCRGDLNNISTSPGYAQSDEHMREMEREAYELGNMCFRDWEDGIKNTIYYEHLQKGELKMSTKDWKNKELRTILSEAWGFKFNTLEEFNSFNENEEIQEISDQDGVADGDMETAGDATDNREEADLEEGKKPMRTDTEDADDDGKTDDEVPAFLKEKEESDEGISEDSGYEEKEHDEHNAWRDEDHIEAIEKHLRALKGDRDYEEDHEKLEEEEVETADPLKEAIKAILTKHLKG